MFLTPTLNVELCVYKVVEHLIKVGVGGVRRTKVTLGNLLEDDGRLLGSSTVAFLDQVLDVVDQIVDRHRLQYRPFLFLGTGHEIGVRIARDRLVLDWLGERHIEDS